MHTVAEVGFSKGGEKRVLWKTTFNLLYTETIIYVKKLSKQGGATPEAPCGKSASDTYIYGNLRLYFCYIYLGLFFSHYLKQIFFNDMQN